MTQQKIIVDIRLEPHNSQGLRVLCGPLDQHLKYIERRLNVEIRHHGNHFHIIGMPPQVRIACATLKRLYIEMQPASGQDILELQPENIHLMLKEEESLESGSELQTGTTTNKKKRLKPRTQNQRLYLETIAKNDITFGIGPAGTGKTYLAVAAAVQALESQQVKRIILTRPAVEAGEKLGFLPGDLSQKVDPYLRPLYDGLYDLLGAEKTTRFLEKQVIEVAPLAYMRGRTLNDAFIILDEAQNTTIEQMKMFVTRIGFNAKVVITGDITQIDLPKNCKSGLKDALNVLQNIEGLGIHYFNATDVVRHPIVARIVNAYEKHSQQ